MKGKAEPLNDILIFKLKEPHQKDLEGGKKGKYLNRKTKHISLFFRLLCGLKLEPLTSLDTLAQLATQGLNALSLWVRRGKEFKYTLKFTKNKKIYSSLVRAKNKKNFLINLM